MQQVTHAMLLLDQVFNNSLAVNYGKNVSLSLLYLVNYSILENKQFMNIIIVSFWNDPTKFGELD